VYRPHPTSSGPRAPTAPGAPIGFDRSDPGGRRARGAPLPVRRWARDAAARTGAALCPPHTRPTLGACGSGGQEGEQEPPAAPGRQLHGAHCGSGPMARAGPGSGRRARRGQRPGAAQERAAWEGARGCPRGSPRLSIRRRGISAPQLHAALPQAALLLHLLRRP
jgi:hypothetical protein